MSDLIASRAIQQMYGVGESAVTRWSQEPDFPEPVVNKRTDKRWERGEVEAWVLAHCVQSSTYGRWRMNRPQADSGVPDE